MGAQRDPHPAKTRGASADFPPLLPSAAASFRLAHLNLQKFERQAKGQAGTTFMSIVAVVITARELPPDKWSNAASQAAERMCNRPPGPDEKLPSAHWTCGDKRINFRARNDCRVFE